MMKSLGVIIFVAVLLLASSMACMQQSAEVLNEGKGTRDDPVAAMKYAKTDAYDVQILSAVRPAQIPTPAGQKTDHEYMKVQFGVKCTRADDQVCNLDEFRVNFKVASEDGILYDPALEIDVPQGDNVLEGEILGGAEQTGWLLYQVPVGVPVTLAVVGYGDDLHVFLKLP
jgi:hypothetical protein